MLGTQDSSVKGSGEVIRAPVPYTSGWGSFVLLKMDRISVAQGGSLNTLHWPRGSFPAETTGSRYICRNILWYLGIGGVAKHKNEKK